MPNNNMELSKANAEPDKNANANSDKKKIMTRIVFLVLGGLLLGYFIGVEAGFRFIVPYVYGLKTEQILKEYAKPYMEDYIGGDTPEETIDLFIEALKKEDLVLASKYFIVGKQEKALEDFKKMDKAKVIEELTYAKNIWHKEMKSNENVEFWYDVTEGEASRDLNLVKNTNNKWKLESL